MGSNGERANRRWGALAKGRWCDKAKRRWGTLAKGRWGDWAHAIPELRLI